MVMHALVSASDRGGKGAAPVTSISLSAARREQLGGAVEHAWCAAWASLAHYSTTRVEDTPDLVRVLTLDSKELLLNAVVRYRQRGAVTTADVERVIAPFRALATPMQWWVRLGADPPGLRQRLREIGMQAWNEIPGMALSLDGWRLPSPPSRALAVRPVASERDAALALGIICDVYGADPAPMRRWCGENPRFTLYLAAIDGQPVGALASQVTRGIAGVFHVATAPRWRRQGAAWALMARALADARDAGAEIAALTATPEAESLYRRLGFVNTCAFEFWMPGLRYVGAW